MEDYILLAFPRQVAFIIVMHCYADNNHQELAAIEADKQRLLDKVKNLFDKLLLILT